MSYKIKKLVDEGFDFNSLFPEKQKEARLSTSLNFTLSEVVEFLRKQTNDFREDFPLAQDLDDSIYRLYEKQKAKGKEVEVEVEEQKELTKEEIQESIDGLQLLADMGDQDAVDTIEGLKLLLLF